MSPVRRLDLAPRQSEPPDLSAHTYTVLVFDELLPAPWVILVDAEDDTKAIEAARALHASKRRELWCGHRLVATFPRWI